MFNLYHGWGCCLSDGLSSLSPNDPLLPPRFYTLHDYKTAKKLRLLSKYFETSKILNQVNNT